MAAFCGQGFQPFNPPGNENRASVIGIFPSRSHQMAAKPDMIRIPHNTYVLVGDGRKALFLRNEGNGAALDLKTERILTNDNPPTREQGSGRPGRSFQSVGSSRSAVEQTDWHEIGEQRFARTIADALEALARDREIPGFVIVAPPRTLADLRQSIGADTKSRVIAEIDKDLTGHPIKDIERHLTA